LYNNIKRPPKRIR